MLFKNKKRKKIIKSFVRKNKAELFFKKCIDDSSRVKFNVEYENANKVVYEIALLVLNEDSQLNLFKQDDLGRNIKIELVDSDYKIINLEKFNLEEKIFDWSSNRRITFEELMVYFSPKDLKNVYTVNNKLIVQIDESINVFSLKNKVDARRLLDILNTFMVSSGRADSLFVKDIDNIHRKYLYSLLERNGIDKKRLYRQSTTFSTRK